ncbi:MAG TPA: DUF2975 domain-containing protein [Steroidobacteraceae bacterium]|nr:DUF2975 domain-containing protein [Steroidobacteraceae bacterium]
MTPAQAQPLLSRLATPLGQNSLSSALSTALKLAHLFISLAFAFGVVAAAVCVPLSLLIAAHLVPATFFTSPGSKWLALWTIAIPYFAYIIVSLRGALHIVRRLQKLFSSFVVNQPFARDNPAHLRAIWTTLVVIEIARIAGFFLMHGLTAALASGSKVGFPGGLDDPIDLVRWFLIFVVLILAEVFRQGAQLREQNELTV